MGTKTMMKPWIVEYFARIAGATAISAIAAN
jgi:hypothetical protein